MDLEGKNSMESENWIKWIFWVAFMALRIAVQNS